MHFAIRAVVFEGGVCYGQNGSQNFCFDGDGAGGLLLISGLSSTFEEVFYTDFFQISALGGWFANNARINALDAAECSQRGEVARLD